MNLKDNLSLLQTIPLNPVERVLSELDDETAEVLRGVLANPQISTRSIHGALKDDGLVIGRDSLTAYRERIKDTTTNDRNKE